MHLFIAFKNKSFAFRFATIRIFIVINVVIIIIKFSKKSIEYYITLILNLHYFVIDIYYLTLNKKLRI